MLAAMGMLEAGNVRPIWPYDTYGGMPPPSSRDRQWNGEAAADRLAAHSAAATGEA
jgi:hypothetical protein